MSTSGISIDVLNNYTGDNKIEIDTDTEDGRKKVAELFGQLIKNGTAIFLERAQETYRVTGYDSATDSLKVEIPTPQAPVTTGKPCACTRCEGCTNLVKKSKYGICSPCQMSKHGGRKITVSIRQKKTDRVTAVAPRAGG